MAKLADALDLGSSAARHVGSSPSIRTILRSYELRMAGQLQLDCQTENARAKDALHSSKSEVGLSRHPRSKAQIYFPSSFVKLPKSLSLFFPKKSAFFFTIPPRTDCYFSSLLFKFAPHFFFEKRSLKFILRI
jgi:hypothetical protein